MNCVISLVGVEVLFCDDNANKSCFICYFLRIILYFPRKSISQYSSIWLLTWLTIFLWCLWDMDLRGNLFFFHIFCNRILYFSRFVGKIANKTWIFANKSYSMPTNPQICPFISHTAKNSFKVRFCFFFQICVVMWSFEAESRAF